MPDFDKIRANPQQYAGEISRWKTAIKKAMKDDSQGYGKKHLYAWGVEDDKPDEKYADLPENGVPRNKLEMVALLDQGRLGPKYAREGLKVTSADALFDEATTVLSGGLILKFDEYIKPEINKEVAKNVDFVRLTLSAALNNEMEVPFMKGQYANYKAVMDWVDQKTEIEVKTEYMFELFKNIDDAMAGDGQVDAKCMEFRMAMDLLYIDEPITFKDWEHSDVKAQIFEKEGYTPATSFMFLYMYKKQLGDEIWKKIEEEFRREITTEKYNKIGWMQNKPILYKIIKKHTKNMPKGKVASLVDTTNDNVVDDSDGEVELEMADGVILKVQPKFKGAGTTWKRNFTKRFNLQQSGNNRWQRRQQQQQPRQPQQQQYSQSQAQNFNRNNADQQKRDSPNAEQTWRCYKCREEGNSRKFKGNQMCPKHKFRPRYFESIPLAGIREIKSSHNSKSDDNNTNNSGNGDDGHLNAIRECLYSASTDDSSHEY